MRKTKYNWLTEDGLSDRPEADAGLDDLIPGSGKQTPLSRGQWERASAAMKPDAWYMTLWGWITSGAEKLWNGIQSVLKWIFGQGKEGEGKSSLLQGIKWIFSKIKAFLSYLWQGKGVKGDEGGAVGAGKWLKGKYDDVKGWSGWGTAKEKLGAAGDYINDKMSANLVGGVSGWGILAGAAVIGIVVYGIYRLYKWYKGRKPAKKSLSESADSQSWINKGLSVTSSLTPNMVGSVFGPAAANFFGGCSMVLKKASSSAKVAEGTYRIMRNTGLKKSAARRIAQHTFSECIAQ